MKAIVVCAAALLALAAASLPAAAQGGAEPFPADSLQELRRGDGTREIGRVVEVRGDTTVFETISGERLEVRSRFVHVRRSARAPGTPASSSSSPSWATARRTP
jgi:hypothetical protein